MATNYEKLMEKMKGQKTQDPAPSIPNAQKRKDSPGIDKGAYRDFDKESEKRQDLNVDGTFIPVPSSRNKPTADGMIPLKKGGRAKKKPPNW